MLARGYSQYYFSTTYAIWLYIWWYDIRENNGVYSRSDYIRIFTNPSRATLDSRDSHGRRLHHRNRKAVSNQPPGNRESQSVDMNSQEDMHGDPYILGSARHSRDRIRAKSIHTHHPESPDRRWRILHNTKHLLGPYRKTPLGIRRDISRDCMNRKFFYKHYRNSPGETQKSKTITHLPMERHEIDILECEANWHTPHHLNAQLAHQKKASLERIIVREAVRELIDWSQVEPGHTPDWPNHTRSINTLR